MIIDLADAEIISGDDVILRITLLNEETGEAYPIEDIQALQEIKYVIATNAFPPVTEVLKTNASTDEIYIDSEGRINIRIVGADTADISGIYRHELQVIDEIGTKTTVFRSCDFPIVEDSI